MLRGRDILDWGTPMRRLPSSATLSIRSWPPLSPPPPPSRNFPPSPPGFTWWSIFLLWSIF